MSFKHALGQARLVTVAVLAAIVWLIIAGLRVLESVDIWGLAGAGVVGDAIGPAAAGGVLGLLTIAITLVLAVHLLGELGEVEPAPDTWPPE